MTATTLRMPGTPPRWINRAMELALRTPGLRRVVGRSFGLITVTGARTGRRYTTPVQPVADGGSWVVLSQRHRRWWRNLRPAGPARLEVGGRAVDTTGRVVDGPAAVEVLVRLLTCKPRVARFYGLPMVNGRPDPGGVAELADRVAVLVLEPDDAAGPDDDAGLDDAAGRSDEPGSGPGR